VPAAQTQQCRYQECKSSCGSGALLLPLGGEVGEVLALFLIPFEGSRRVEPRLRTAEVGRWQINLDSSHCARDK